MIIIKNQIIIIKNKILLKQINDNDNNNCKFRSYSNNLSIVASRYTNVERKDRLCIQCTMSMIEDDYHVLLVCQKYRHLRQKLFTPYFCKWPSLQKFTTLMSSSSPKALLKLVFKERQT